MVQDPAPKQRVIITHLAACGHLLGIQAVSLYSFRITLFFIHSREVFCVQPRRWESFTLFTLLEISKGSRGRHGDYQLLSVLLDSDPFFQVVASSFACASSCQALGTVVVLICEADAKYHRTHCPTVPIPAGIQWEPNLAVSSSPTHQVTFIQKIWLKTNQKPATSYHQSYLSLCNKVEQQAHLYNVCVFSATVSSHPEWLSL